MSQWAGVTGVHHFVPSLNWNLDNCTRAEDFSELLLRQTYCSQGFGRKDFGYSAEYQKIEYYKEFYVYVDVL